MWSLDGIREKKRGRGRRTSLIFIHSEKLRILQLHCWTIVSNLERHCAHTLFHTVHSHTKYTQSLNPVLNWTCFVSERSHQDDAQNDLFNRKDLCWKLKSRAFHIQQFNCPSTRSYGLHGCCCCLHRLRKTFSFHQWTWSLKNHLKIFTKNRCETHTRIYTYMD